MKKLLILLFIILSTFLAYSEDTTTDKINDEKDTPLIEQYKDTLSYGIDEEVVNILKKLGPNPKKEFYPLLFERYKETSLQKTKISFINYFSNCKQIPSDILEYLYTETKNDPDDIKLHSTLLAFLGLKGGEREGLLLIERLDHIEYVIQMNAASSLSKMSIKELISPILKRLNESDTNDEKYLDDEIKSKLILSFGKMKAVEAVNYLKEQAQDTANDKFIIMYSMHSLAEIGDPSAIPIIEKNLYSEDIKIQEYAGYSLSLFKNKNVIPIFKKMLKNNREQIRIYACQGLVLNEDISSIKILLYKFTNDPSTRVKGEALAAIIYMGNPGITELKKYFTKNKYNAFHYFIISDAISQKPDSTNVSYLLEVYEKGNKKEKESMAKNIVNGKSNKLDPLIKVLLNSEDYLLRIGAIKAVYNIEDSTLWGKVKELSENDPNENVKKTAKNFLSIKK